MEEKKRPTIAIMHANTQSEYSEELISGFFTCAKEEDINLIFLMGPQMPQYCAEILSGSFSWDYDYQFHTVYDYEYFVKPDALIVAYGSLAAFESIPDRKEFLERYQEIPNLLVGDIERELAVPYLIAGNYDGMRKCVEHLVVEHGYRRIGFVSGPARNFDSKERLRAYHDVLSEHGIEIKDGWIVYGNYTEYVDEVVEELLDNYPDLEAIVFANDNMAKAGYRVCAMRDLLVGHDIAITGFDDVDIAKSMKPPLTSVSHSSFLFSYEALQMALELCRGEHPASREMEAFFHRRSSCGCKFNVDQFSGSALLSEELQTYIERRVLFITEELYGSIPYEKEKMSYRQQLLEYFTYIRIKVFEENGVDFSQEQLLRYLKKLCAYTYISKRVLQEFLSVLLDELIQIADDEEVRLLLGRIIVSTEQYIYSQDVMELQTQIRDSICQLWFVPSFTLDLVNDSINFENNMKAIMKRLAAMNVKSTYFFLFEEPVLCHADEKPQFPEQLYLTAFYNEKEIVCYGEGKGIPITTENGFCDVLLQDKSCCYTAFVLFSGEMQYGLMVCEVKQKDIPFTLVCSQQIGSLFRVMQIHQSEQRMKRELEEKNRILSFISTVDELTQVLNRRGFMEQGLLALAAHHKERAVLLFADVDHLKEINDCFGHAAGDFAICTAAGYLKSCLPEDALIARIGGDEFVALVFPGENIGINHLIDSLKVQAKQFNESCEKPFYVELSTGAHTFVNDGTDELTDLLSQSDQVLYQDKAKRRKSIKKPF